MGSGPCGAYLAHVVLGLQQPYCIKAVLAYELVPDPVGPRDGVNNGVGLARADPGGTLLAVCRRGVTEVVVWRRGWDGVAKG
jgi:hypothetical protein